WVEARGVAADADVRLLAVVHDPCEIARRESRVEEAVEARLAFERHAFENVLDADDPLAVLVEFEVARDARARAVAADDVAGRDARRVNRVFELVLAINQQHAHAPTRQKPRQLKTGKPRAHDYNVELFHKHFPSESSNSRGSRSRYCPCGQRLNSVFLCKKL